MKTQQRKFVVEFKSARRRSKTQPASIWAGTDLEAAVRETASQTPNLFGPSAVSIPAVQESQIESVPVPVRSIHVPSESRTDQTIQVPVAAFEAPTVQQKDGVTVSSDSKADTMEPEVTLLNQSAPPSKQRAARQKNRVPQASNRATRLAKIDTQFDDLAGLEEENRRLKRLLAIRLRQENLQLQTMLRRFGDY
jgi:hypothetical protein